MRRAAMLAIAFGLWLCLASCAPPADPATSSSAALPSSASAVGKSASPPITSLAPVTTATPTATTRSADQLFLAEVRTKSPKLAESPDAKLVDLGRWVCKKLREGQPTRVILQDMVKPIIAWEKSGGITQAEADIHAMEMADIASAAPTYYCHEQSEQVERDFAQIASGG